MDCSGTIVSLRVDAESEETVTIEGRAVPRADVARFVTVGRDRFAVLLPSAAEAHGLSWHDD